MHRAIALAGTLLLVAAPAFAGDISVPMNLVDAAGKATPIGTVRVVETAYGQIGRAHV